MLNAKHMMVSSSLLLASAFSLEPLALTYPSPFPAQVRPISDHGNVNEIIGKFGGADQLPEAVGQLQTLLYAE